MKKERFKGFISGFVVAAIIFGITATGWAATGQQAITVGYNNIKVYIDNVLTEMKDPNGKTVEPFIYDGTTYVPLRAVSEALNKEVTWNNDTKSIYIGEQPQSNPETNKQSTESNTYSRSNPAPVGTPQTITIDDYSGKYTVTIKVTEAFRGQVAWAAIREANRFNAEPTDKNEYVLLAVEATIDKAENDKAVSLNDYDFKIYDSSNSEYERVSVVSPKPEFDGSAYEGGKIEGFMAFAVSTSDSNPKIVFGQNYDGTGGIWFSAVK